MIENGLHRTLVTTEHYCEGSIYFLIASVAPGFGASDMTAKLGGDTTEKNDIGGYAVRCICLISAPNNHHPQDSGNLRIGASYILCNVIFPTLWWYKHACGLAMVILASRQATLASM